MFKRLTAILTLSGLSRVWQVAVYILAGLAIGLALLVARIANAVSYLSSSPETCMNCHVMTDAYASWQRGSHGKVAVCTDCHLPHSNVVAKTAFKGTEGLKDSYIFFASRQEPQVPRLSQVGATVVQSNCLRCHSDQFMMIRLAGSAERKCWDCHENIHGSVQSLSASPQLLRPQLPDAGLKWMKKGSKP